MEQRIIAQEQGRYIYWIKNNTDEFYLTIPATKKASLVLNLLNSVDDNTIKTLKEEQDCIFVTPRISQDLSAALKQNSAEAFTAVAESLAREINLSHKILTYNHLELENLVLLKPNQEFQMFETWFMKKHPGKIVLKDLREDEILRPVQPQVNTPVAAPIDPPKQATPTEPVQEEVKTKTLKREESFGFVSYVLLGVVVVVASLLFLYFIL